MARALKPTCVLYCLTFDVKPAFHLDSKHTAPQVGSGCHKVHSKFIILQNFTINVQFSNCPSLQSSCCHCAHRSRMYPPCPTLTPPPLCISGLGHVHCMREVRGSMVAVAKAV